MNGAFLRYKRKCDQKQNYMLLPIFNQTYRHLYSMIEEQNSQLLFHSTIQCIYDQNVSAYCCSLQIKNITNSLFHFQITSTFGRYLSEPSQPRIRKIQPKQEINLLLKMRTTNMISKNKQKLKISYSKKQISSLLFVEGTDFKEISLEFNGDFEDNQFIEEMMKNDNLALCQQVTSTMNNGLVVNAMHKFQEAFQLYRHSEVALFGLADCQLKMGDYYSALQDIQTALLFTQNEEFLVLKIKIILAIYQDTAVKNHQLFRYCQKMIRKLIVKKKQMSFSESLLIQIHDLSEKLNEFQIEQQNSKNIQLKERLIKRALQNYADNEFQLSKWYKNMNALEDELIKVFNESEQTKNKFQQTPEYVIDPISYEIISKASVLPSGVSYDNSNLNQYFKINGYKDPLNRTIIHPHWVIDNHSLNQFILQHPNLNDWKQYEKMATKL